MNDSTTKKVIILVLALSFSFPLFTFTSFIKEPDSFNCGLELLLKLRDSKMSIEDKHILFNEVVKLQSEINFTPLIYFKITQKGHSPREW